MLNLVQKLLHIWLHLFHSDLQVKQISTAMTNLVYEVTSSIQDYSIDYESNESAAMEPEKLLLRVYGPSTWMFEREREEKIVYALMASGVSPPWLGIFGNGRIEEFIPSSTVSAQRFRQPEVAKAVLGELYRLHASLDQVTQLVSLPREEALWERLGIWRSKAAEAFKSLQVRIGPEDVEHYKMIQTLLGWNVFDGPIFGQLCERSRQCHSPLVFGHCDVSVSLSFCFSYFWIASSRECTAQALNKELCYY